NCLNSVRKFGSIKLDGRHTQLLILFGSQRQHRKPMKRRSDICVSFVRRHASRNKNYFIQFKELPHAASNFEMSVMHRIERATVNRYAPQGHQLLAESPPTSAALQMGRHQEFIRRTG